MSSTSTFKKLFFALYPKVLSIFFILLLSSQAKVSAQCTQAKVNWDWQYKVSGFTSPAKFGIGINSMTMAWGTGITSPATPANATFTGYGTGGYGDGRMAQFATANGTMTLTFAEEVTNVKFAIYDIDFGQAVTITALNAASSSQIIGLTKTNASTSTSSVRISGHNTTSATATYGSALDIIGLDNASTISGANIDIAGPVKTITLTFTKNMAIADPIWLSDISACINGTYLNNYQAVATPETNQPDYLIATDASNSVYAINTATAVATRLFTDASLTTINSLAYDPFNFVFYYANGEGATSNKAIYKYDLRACTKTTFIADVSVSPFNILLNSQGVGGGGAAFYNGSLFFGIDAGVAVTEDNAVWRIDLDNTGAAISASRVFSVQANDGATSLYNWGDFVINNGTLFNFNSGLTPDTDTKIVHFDLNSQNSTVGYSTANTGQVALGYNGRVYNVTNAIAVYNNTGTFGTATTITGDSWTGAAQDAAEAFKFPADYGDAPLTYGRPFHQFVPCSVTAAGLGALKIGNTVDYEIEPLAGTSADGDNTANYANSGTLNDEDGMVTFPALTINNSGWIPAYSLTIPISNTSESTANLHSWIDFNGDGQFSANEYAAAVIANGATTATLSWPAQIVGVAKAGLTYARFRLTSTPLTDVAGTLVDERSTAAAFNGEIEDYAVNINLTITGTVYQDSNGLTDNLVNGTAIGNAAGAQLYAYLVAGNTITGKRTLSATGIFTFNPADANTTYNIILTTINTTVGSSAPATVLPAGWVSVGEGIGTTNESGVPNSQYTITTGTSHITGINFGIEQVPASSSVTYSIVTPEYNGIYALTGFNKMGPLAGNDPEDGILGSTNSFIITSLAAMNGNELYYNNVLLQANSRIVNYNPSLLAIKFSGLNSIESAFDFTFLDAAEQPSLSPATYTISWSMLLPVTLKSFEVQKGSNQAIIQWATAFEKNTESFAVEHSLDGFTWTILGTRMAVGNSAEPVLYNFTHNNPAKGANYYRLKMLDMDGSFTYSPIKNVSFSLNLDFSVYPNPVKDRLYFIGKNYQLVSWITIHNNNGQLVQQVMGLNAASVDMQQLPAGLYLVTIYEKVGRVQSFKVLKN